MTYRVEYAKRADKSLLSVAASTKGELARGLKELSKTWGDKLDFPKFMKKDGEFITAVAV